MFLCVSVEVFFKSGMVKILERLLKFWFNDFWMLNIFILW